MLSEADREAVILAARRYGARRVLLFGSCASSGAQGHDIDLAVEGVAPARFFEFYGEVMFSVSKPVDIVDLAVEGRFSDMVRREGVLIYG